MYQESHDVIISLLKVIFVLQEIRDFELLRKYPPHPSPTGEHFITNIISTWTLNIVAKLGLCYHYIIWIAPSIE